MPTHFERFELSVSLWSSKADDYGIYGVDVQRVRNLVTEAGAQTEVLLKTVVLPHLHPRTNLKGCIDALESHGVEEPDRAILHSLREHYNNAKHEPSWSPSLLDIQRVLSRLGSVVGALALNNVGLLNAEIPMRFHQIFWLAIWDHYIGGDSEVHVIAPYREGDPPTLDMVYVHLIRWEQIETTLASFGSVRDSEGFIPAEILASFRETSDFYRAVVFEGRYRDLVAVLASFERREALMAGLRREDDLQAMVQAFILGTIDAAQELANLSSQEGLALSISMLVKEVYAVPDDYAALAVQSSEFATMVMALPEAKRSQINGPVWERRDEFDQRVTSALSRHPRFPILISDDGTLQIYF